MSISLSSVILNFVPFRLIFIGRGNNNVIIGKGRSEIIGGFRAGGLANPKDEKGIVQNCFGCEAGVAIIKLKDISIQYYK